MKWFKRHKSDNHLALEKAKIGDIIYITHSYVEGSVKCLVENNDPKEQKIFLAIDYNKEKNSCQTKEIIHYGDPRLRHFKAMNIKMESILTKQTIEDKLEEELKSALQEEKYEVAAKIKKAIEILK